MLKPLHLSVAVSVTALIASIPQIVLSRPLSDNSGYPSMSSAPTGSLYCYMQTVEGQTIDLRSLCGTGDAANTPSGGVNQGLPNTSGSGMRNMPGRAAGGNAGAAPATTTTSGKVTTFTNPPSKSSPTPTGTVVNSNGQTTGIINRDGTVVTPTGQVTGVVSGDGTIVTPTGQTSGIINRDGTIVNPNGASTGTLLTPNK